MQMKHPSLTQRLIKWTKAAKTCERCDISQFCTHKVYYSARLPHDKLDLLFVGEAPGQSEYNEQEPFIGPAGQTLQLILEEALPNNISYVLTNSILCTPWEDESLYNIRTPSLSEIRECSHWLGRLIRHTKPRGIIALGVLADKALKLLHSKFPIPEHIKIVHPSAIMQSTKYDYEFDNAVLQIQQYLEGLE